MSGEHENVNAVRKRQLKNLLDEGESVKNEKQNELDRISSIKSIIKSTNNIIKDGCVQDRVQNTSEVVMDAQIIKMGHEILGEIMEKVVSSEFSDEEYYNALARVVFKDNGENWDDLANIAIKVACTATFSASVLGAIDDNLSITEKEKTQNQERANRSKNETTKESRPENLKKIDKRDDGGQRVNAVMKQTRKLYVENNQRPIPFYKLVIDPDNFMNTIDNVFQVSFLVRDNKLGTQTDKDGFPQITVPTREQSRGNFTDTDTIQAICSFNPQFIKRMIEKYKIREPLLPENIEEKQ